jgi:tetratricopeptide (TPR) repeat protein
VAEEAEGQEHSTAEARSGVDPVAVSLALGAVAQNERVAAKAEAFLEMHGALSDEQRALTRLQREVLEEERQLNLSHLHHRRFSDFSKSALEIAIGLVILLFVCGLGTMVWNAAEDRDLVVDAFSVPPDVAQTGLTGSVLASRILDRFGEMDRNSYSFLDDISGYHRAAGEDVRVEIPDTGISIGELNRYLRTWLGHETHVTGELVRADKAISLTIRYGDEPGITVDGTPHDLDGLVQSSAENLFRAAHVLRFADYLATHGRFAEAEAIAKRETQVGSDAHRAAAYLSLGVLYYRNGDERAMALQGPMAVRLDPKSLAAWFLQNGSAVDLDHNEEDWRSANVALPLARSGPVGNDVTGLARSLPVVFEAESQRLKGDGEGVIESCKGVTGTFAFGCYAVNLSVAYASLHNFARSRTLMDEAPATRSNGAPDLDLVFDRAQNALAAGDLSQALSWSTKAEALVAKDKTQFTVMLINLRPYEAEALARTGDIAGAERLVATTPLDCDGCVRARGRIAMIARNWSGAEHWFAIVSARSPDIPFADTDWGEMLLAKGNIDGAIAKLTQANLKGPHFADPLEMWGEALMLKNRSDLALAKFEEANKYAPNWGRLHLEWGKALFFAGRRDEAAKQFAVAARLDLAPSEKSILARMEAAHG